MKFFFRNWNINRDIQSYALRLKRVNRRSHPQEQLLLTEVQPKKASGDPREGEKHTRNSQDPIIGGGKNNKLLHTVESVQDGLSMATKFPFDTRLDFFVHEVEDLCRPTFQGVSLSVQPMAAYLLCKLGLKLGAFLRRGASSGDF